MDVYPFKHYKADYENDVELLHQLNSSNEGANRTNKKKNNWNSKNNFKC